MTDGVMPAAIDELKALLSASPRLTLAVAESLTCGQVQARIGAISGASTFFQGGVTAYTLEHKVGLLGVDRATAVASDCVSEPVARQMARGACLLFGSDLALATTGYAERPPAGGGSGPFAWWALAHRRGDGQWIERAGRLPLPEDTPRVEVQTAVAAAVIAELIRYLRAWRA